jgi:hypothetical protein
LMYDWLNGHTYTLIKKFIWKLKVPLKIKLVKWFLHKKVILTNDNLIIRNWHGSTKCSFVIKRRQLDTFLYHVL